MTHTPGPWTTGSDKEGDEYAFCIVQNKSWRGQQFIARVEPCGTDGGTEEAEANARLIAAAPALLEALEEAASWLDPKHTGQTSTIVKARATIALAKGENK